MDRVEVATRYDLGTISEKHECHRGTKAQRSMHKSSKIVEQKGQNRRGNRENCLTKFRENIGRNKDGNVQNVKNS